MQIRLAHSSLCEHKCIIHGQYNSQYQVVLEVADVDLMQAVMHYSCIKSNIKVVLFTFNFAFNRNQIYSYIYFCGGGSVVLTSAAGESGPAAPERSSELRKIR